MAKDRPNEPPKPQTSKKEFSSRAFDWIIRHRPSLVTAVLSLGGGVIVLALVVRIQY